MCRINIYKANYRNNALYVTNKQKHKYNSHKANLGSSTLGKPLRVFLLYTTNKSRRTVETKILIPVNNKVVLRKAPNGIHNNSVRFFNNIVNGSVGIHVYLSIYLSIHPSIYLSVCMSIYSPFVGPWLLFQFLDPMHSR
jgi:hypothetical protein